MRPVTRGSSSVAEVRGDFGHFPNLMQPADSATTGSPHRIAVAPSPCTCRLCKVADVDVVVVDVVVMEVVGYETQVVAWGVAAKEIAWTVCVMKAAIADAAGLFAEASLV